MHDVVLVTVRIDFGDERVEIGVGSERALRHELLATCGTLFIAGSQRRDNAVVTEAVQTLFGRHGAFEDVQADGTHEFVVQTFGRDRDLRFVVDDLVWLPVQLIHVQFPCLRVVGQIAHYLFDLN